MNRLRINKTWINTAEPKQIIKNRLKRYPAQAFYYYIPVFRTIHKDLEP